MYCRDYQLLSNRTKAACVAAASVITTTNDTVYNYTTGQTQHQLTETVISQLLSCWFAMWARHLQGKEPGGLPAEWQDMGKH